MLARLHSCPNHPVEQTAHSAGFPVAPSPVGCGPLLTASVRRIHFLLFWLGGSWKNRRSTNAYSINPSQGGKEPWRS
jgi:hypothetical protein